MEPIANTHLPENQIDLGRNKGQCLTSAKSNNLCCEKVDQIFDQSKTNTVAVAKVPNSYGGGQLLGLVSPAIAGGEASIHPKPEALGNLNVSPKVKSRDHSEGSGTLRTWSTTSNDHSQYRLLGYSRGEFRSVNYQCDRCSVRFDDTSRYLRHWEDGYISSGIVLSTETLNTEADPPIQQSLLIAPKFVNLHLHYICTKFNH